MVPLSRGSRPGPALELALGITLSLALLGACDRSKLPYFGQLREPCYPNGTCAVGLVCRANRCRLRDDAGPPVDSRPPADQATDGPGTCWPPGSPCASDDPCTIKAACGSGGTCQVLERLNCDDNLACTEDRCSSPTSCQNRPKSGRCALDVKEGDKLIRRCFSSGDERPDTPCLVCAPEVSSRKWSAAKAGTGCDDGDDCTQDDRCAAGSCTGKPYGTACDDKLACTQDRCDGKGGCVEPKPDADACVIALTCYKEGDLGSPDDKTCGSCEPQKSQSAWTPLAASCRVAGTCYRATDKHPKGCASCDPVQATDAWTVDPGRCLIGGVCTKTGALGPTLCAACDPKLDPRSWSPLPNRCQIDGACLKQQDKHPSGCLVCDPQASGKSWSPLGPATTARAEGFDDQLALPSGWSETHTDTTNKVRWRVVASSTRAKEPPNALYYGDPAAKSYRTGNTKNAGTVSWKGIELAAGGKAGLRAFVWMDLENSSTYDRVIIRLNDGPKTSVLWQKPAGQSGLRKWVTIDVDLTAWAGKKDLTLEIEFDTVDHLNNSREGVYIDQLTIYSGC